VAGFDWSVLWCTLEVTGAAVLLSTLIGVPLGAWLGQSRSRGQRILTALVHTGMGFPPVVIGLAVYLLFSRTGPLGSIDWLFTPRAMIVAQAVIATPLVMGITAAAAAAVPTELLLQVRSLGASGWQARWAVLREARPGIVTAIAAGFGRVIAEVGAAQLVGGDIAGHTRVLTTAIVLETRMGHFAVAMALGGWLIGLALLVNLLGTRLQGRPVP